MKHVILYGYKGCGKTYFGSLLAQKMARAFIDTDREIEKLYANRNREALSCRQIVYKIGMEEFRKLETEIIKNLSLLLKIPSIISVGGGAVLDKINCETLQKIGKLIYLEASPVTLQQQMVQDGMPAFLSPVNPLASFHETYETRKKVYEAVSPYKICLEGKTEKEIIHSLQNLSQ